MYLSFHDYTVKKIGKYTTVCFFPLLFGVTLPKKWIMHQKMVRSHLLLRRLLIVGIHSNVWVTLLFIVFLLYFPRVLIRNYGEMTYTHRLFTYKRQIYYNIGNLPSLFEVIVKNNYTLKNIGKYTTVCFFPLLFGVTEPNKQLMHQIMVRGHLLLRRLPMVDIHSNICVDLLIIVFLLCFPRVLIRNYGEMTSTNRLFTSIGQIYYYGFSPIIVCKLGKKYFIHKTFTKSMSSPSIVLYYKFLWKTFIYFS